MGVKELCEKFIAADKIINGENYGNLTMDQIINDPKFNEYCPNSNCEADIQPIGALSAYLFMKARVLETTVMETSGLYDEFFLMWLSDKLFNIVKDKPQINDITLNEACEQHLKNNIVDSNKLDFLDKINGLKEVNLMYMKQFYKLLNPICKAIVYYKPNKDDTEKLIDYSAECYNQYSSIYDSVSECISYLRLLDNLKNTYYSFINDVINKDEKNKELAWKLKTLKTSDETDDYFAKDFKEFDFNCSECKPKKTQTDEPNHKKGSEDSKSRQTSLDSGIEGTSTGPKGPDSAPGASETQSTSWSFFGIGSYISTIASKGKEQLNNAVTSLETIKKKVTETTTNTIQNLYSRSVSNIQAAYDKSTNLLYGAIGNINSYYKHLGNIFIQNYDHSGSGGTGGGVPTPNDPSPPQKDSPQTPSGISHNSLPLPDPKEQTNGLQLSQDPSGKQNSDQNHQRGSKIPVVKQEVTGTKVKGNGTTGIGDIYVLKEYKQIGISIIVLLIPISLAIMYKYLSYGWRKELKRKKNMKKVINSIGGKRSVEIIISSSSRKKQTKKSINSVHRKKPPLLNIYKLMQADPIPFINLFFLLIFFIYKRKYDFLEL
ncbi:PIR protein CIR protein [Plasmodium vinckei brucechwatti]|uniref:PIR protein CIR protein n=1 Tax=Plasmodium vinckei brucechwatti TaxID=119398 RepID=A0A6V7RUY2_PLAVN|nr:PIR protein CIR protein [Plasmodium vinckei brucechwatti]